jgi:two-component system sensor histidine kinase PilS (NtrC family)
MRNPLQIGLDDWLQNFKAVFMQSHNCDDNSIIISPTRQQVNVDPDHLHQIITNLCENGMRYGTSGSVSISGGRLPENGAPFIDVTNDGPEISRELQEKIFEPFFTTENKGTGLGLFLARELCHDNNARLDYVHSPEGGQFRIQFPLRADAA